MMPIPEADSYATHRSDMVNVQLRQRGIKDEPVLNAMLNVPRHEFIPEQYRSQAYEDHPLPIGEGQTISQPYIVALMLEALTLSANDKVLEVGAGSGYVTALLSELADQVLAVERLPSLALEAQQVLARLGYTNAEIFIGDGSVGLPPYAPFDAIIVSAATVEVPQALLSQLKDNGRMIIPVGATESQLLQLIRIQNGKPLTTLREACRFVPLISSIESQ